MKKRLFPLMAVLILLLLITGGCSQNGATGTSETGSQTKSTFEVTDLLGRRVVVPAKAEKFVAIGPGCLRLYCYTADVTKLVGIEDFERLDVAGRPYMIVNKELLDLDVIGPGGPNNTPDAEKLLVADPDVIFSMYNSDVSAVDELQQKTGIPVVALSYGSTEMFDPAVDRSIELIGKITGNEKRADEVIGYFAELKADLASRVQDVTEEEKPLAYMGCMGMRGSHGIESTTGNYSIFNAISARNAVAEAGVTEYVMLDKEKLLDMDPDYIFLDGSGLALVYEDYKKSPNFYDGLKAFKNNDVYMQLPYNYYYTNIGVAIANAYYIGTILYPEQFSDIDPVSKFDEIMVKFLGDTAYKQMAETYNGGYQQLKFE